MTRVEPELRGIEVNGARLRAEEGSVSLTPSRAVRLALVVGAGGTVRVDLRVAVLGLEADPPPKRLAMEEPGDEADDSALASGGLGRRLPAPRRGRRGTQTARPGVGGGSVSALFMDPNVDSPELAKARFEVPLREQRRNVIRGGRVALVDRDRELRMTPWLQLVEGECVR